MKLLLNRACQLAIVIAGTIFISGCANTQYSPDEFQEGKSVKDGKPGIAAEINKVADNICALPPTTSPNYWDLRHVRSQILLSAITRYGAARIEDYYGGEQDVRGAYLLAKVNSSAIAIKQAMSYAKTEVAFHSIEQVDVINNLLHTADAAMKATTDKIKNFALAPNLADGKEFFKKALEDALYAQAYKDDCANMIQAGEANAARIPAIKAEVNKHLVEQCLRLAKMSGLQHSCTIP